ncbi:hypothetical protein [uncultured Tateyamaria sp.]|uniref:hypothetical protein n=1 Tax=uncultured Tateyamaria sp. TaxID=455651 RepID=UPI00262102B5|nr:hypothetical protein [uncultured Tateyamaria sp.]
MSQDVFAARLERLNGKHAQHAQSIKAEAQAQRGPMPEWVRNIGYPGSLVAACLIGVLTVLLSRYVMFHLNGVPDPEADADMTMLIDGGLAAALAFVIRSALNMTSKEHLACKAAGIWIALTCMHNAVHAYPAIWATTFSPEWVERTTEMTKPRSFYISGMSFEIGGAKDATTPQDGPAPAGKEIKINRH